jgi:hypothetical protein
MSGSPMPFAVDLHTHTRFEREVASVEELVAELRAGRFRAVHSALGLVL